MKHKPTTYAYEVMKKWGVRSWETYDVVVNWISVGSLLAIASINKLPSISHDFKLGFKPI